jgi:hypothetical protein
MDSQRPRHISVIDPIGPAITTVEKTLFKPFDLAKWFVIGFCAWLAGLGSSPSGPHFNFNVPASPETGDLPQAITSNLSWIIPIAVIGLIVVLAIWIVICWLSSRSKFMFLHCLAHNRAEVKVPWNKFRQQGNSLFIFRLVVGAIALVCLAALVGLMVFLITSISENNSHSIAPAAAGLAFVILLLIVVSIFFVLLMKFTYDFVVPVMFLGTAKCTDAWRRFLRLLAANKAHLALYILFQIVISIAIAAIIFAVALGTCCCAFCIMSIPYIGTVLLLPILTFRRAYSALYLSQYGPELDVFQA